MTFFVGRTKEFLRYMAFENYNGSFGSVHKLNSTEPPFYILMNIPLYNFKDELTACVTTNKRVENLIVRDDLILWCCVRPSSKNKDELDYIKKSYTIDYKDKPNDLNELWSEKLFNIINHEDWLNKLEICDLNITFLLKDSDNYYLYRKREGEIWVDKNMNISTKPFNDAELIKSNIVYLVDFENNELIDLEWTLYSKLNITE